MGRLRKPKGWPRYMIAKKLKGGQIAYYWNAPNWARRHSVPPPMSSKALGADYSVAIQACNDVLNPLFDAWVKEKDLSRQERKKLRDSHNHLQPLIGTFRWLSHEFTQTREFNRLAPLTQTAYREGLEFASEFALRNDPLNRCFGDLRLNLIDADAADTLYDALQFDGEGKKRIRRAYKSMQACRRAWFVLSRRRPKQVPQQNPFSRMSLRTPDGPGAVPATLPELQAFVEMAETMGHPSIGIAAHIAWEWMLREKDILETLSWSNYRAKGNPNDIKLRHSKNRVDVLMPLNDDEGAALYPELERRFAELPKRGTLMIMRDNPDRLTGEYLPYKVSHFHKLVRKILDAAGLQHLVFSSFRKGGETECGDADLTDQQMMALDGHKTRDMLTVYVVRSRKQRVLASQKRRLTRTKQAQLSE